MTPEDAQRTTLSVGGISNYACACVRACVLRMAKIVNSAAVRHSCFFFLFIWFNCIGVFFFLPESAAGGLHPRGCAGLVRPVWTVEAGLIYQLCSHIRHLLPGSLVFTSLPPLILFLIDYSRVFFGGGWGGQEGLSSAKRGFPVQKGPNLV